MRLYAQKDRPLPLQVPLLYLACLAVRLGACSWCMRAFGAAVSCLIWRERPLHAVGAPTGYREGVQLLVWNYMGSCFCEWCRGRGVRAWGMLRASGVHERCTHACILHARVKGC
jgi:hypothetical protein